MNNDQSLKNLILTTVDAFNKIQSRQRLLEIAINREPDDILLLLHVYLNETETCFEELANGLETIRVSFVNRC